ncbi:hypothetical protein WICPIJ_005028 [Wickerhamomyces pijperi]|uniref:Uncharacterized protein n=1 Tax=Wickerhamomyces pijperi TaxID=599730 RepID=A0A9P8TMC8_WICPI|nr:hypothetical protein WICPIJ_005028 [Wickerhamomyces pijperi]
MVFGVKKAPIKPINSKPEIPIFHNGKYQITNGKEVATDQKMKELIMLEKISKTLNSSAEIGLKSLSFFFSSSKVTSADSKILKLNSLLEEIWISKSDKSLTLQASKATSNKIKPHSK